MDKSTLLLTNGLLSGLVSKHYISPQEHTELQEKYACLQETVSEQEIALVEMGKQLSM